MDSQSLVATLDSICARLATDPTPSLVQHIIEATEQHRRSMPPARWRSFVTDTLRPHPIHGLLRQDPYTERAFAKPRGYAGDAVMLDYVYGIDRPSHAGMGAVGLAVWEATTRAPSADAVRDRRLRLARFVDEAANRRPGASIVSVAAGHAREISDSEAFRERRLTSWTCLDQDRESLAEISARFAGNPTVVPVARSVRELLDGAFETQADLVYSAGLFDYLPDAAASKLLAVMWDWVRPGGRLVLANFADDSQERGYMEAFMDWWLLYRNEDQMWALGQSLEDVGALVVFRDPSARTIWLELQRRSEP
jgi:extracellular factor (EF) 3-hydroxypalmitic acid methyl ester biosynthesis protein